LRNVSEKIKLNAAGKDRYAIYLPTNEWAPFVIFGIQSGSTLLKDHDRYGDFSGSQFNGGFTFLIKMIHDGLSPIGVSQVTNVYQAFSEEYFVMYISGPWNIPEFKKWMSGPLRDKWSTAPLPGPDAATPGVSLAGGSSLVMSRLSKKKVAAWKFIEFLSQPQVQLKFYQLLNDLPAVKDAWQDTTLANDPYMKAFFQQFHHVAATPKVPEWEQIAFAKVQLYAELAARKRMTAGEALKKLDDDVDRILEKRRWLLSGNPNNE
jgi:multiple sugar transport system substrate-binding protein